MKALPKNTIQTHRVKHNSSVQPNGVSSTYRENICNKKVKNTLFKIKETYNKYQDIELFNKLESNDDNNLAWDMCELLNTWCDSNSDSECKKFFNDIKVFEITLGEFVKAILKINNIGNELEKIAIIQNNLNLLEKIKKLKILTLKSVVTNQSLYI